MSNIWKHHLIYGWSLRTITRPLRLSILFPARLSILRLPILVCRFSRSLIWLLDRSSCVSWLSQFRCCTLVSRLWLRSRTSTLGISCWNNRKIIKHYQWQKLVVLKIFLSNTEKIHITITLYRTRLCTVEIFHET